VVVLNGPNLNLLGTREPHIYGHTTLPEIDEELRVLGEALGLAVECFQSNHEGELIDWIQEADVKKVLGIVLNAGAYTHSSIALRDVIAAVAVPVIEVHVSNIFAREEFRHRSYIAPVARGTLSGFGIAGYALAIDGLAATLTTARKP